MKQSCAEAERIDASAELTIARRVTIQDYKPLEVKVCTKLEIIGDNKARCMANLSKLTYSDGDFYRDDYCPIETEEMGRIGAKETAND